MKGGNGGGPPGKAPGGGGNIPGGIIEGTGTGGAA